MLLKLNPSKFKELLNVFDINKQSNRLTLFTQLGTVPKDIGAVYVEKSDFEIAFEAYLQEMDKTA